MLLNLSASAVRLAVLVALLSTVPACTPQQAGDRSAATPVAEYRAFGAPQRVTIRGYDGDAMEPFITKDGQYLLFNNRNDPRTNTNLHFAARVDNLTFQYRGEIKGVNTPALEGVPSLDREGNLYFVSVRSYKETLSTLYRGRFNDGTVTGVDLVSGVSQRKPGIVMFDAEITADGRMLFVVDGLFTGGPVPKSADIVIAVRYGTGFQRLPASPELLRKIITKGLEYAPAISNDLLELFFTRIPVSNGPPQPLILRSSRRSVEDPFGLPEKVAAITGFVEAPTLTNDGQALYFHKLDGNRFVIYRVAR